LGIFQVSFLAKAADDAVPGADRARVRVGASGWAGGAAGTEDFVFTALFDWWQHHKGGRRRVDWVYLGALDSLDAAAVFADVILLAGAARDAYEWAGNESVFASSIAAFAFAVFLVIAALLLVWRHHSCHRGHMGGAFAGQDALAVIANVSLFAGAARAADEGADHIGILASAIASLACTVFFIWEAELTRQQHGFDGGAAAYRRNAHALLVFQVAGFAKASDDAVPGADWAGMRIGACRRAGGAAGLEFLVQTALGVFWGHGKSRSGDSSAKGANTEQQQESKAKGHR